MFEEGVRGSTQKDIYMLTRRAAPPIKAPMATAAVGMAPALGPSVVVWTAPEVALATRELCSASRLLMLSATLPVAVERMDSSCD